jgi:hypothetical protein
MIDELLSERTADAILSGRTDRQTIAPELQRIVELLDVVRSPAVPQELDGEDAMVAAVLEAMGATEKRVDVDAQRRRRAKRRMAKGVVAFALVALTGTAAAATNHLPEAIQTAVSDATSHVGVHLPKPKHDSQSDTKVDAPPAGTDTSPSQGVGPDATGPAKGGLCTAHFARGTTPSEHAGGVAEQNLQAAAAAAGQTIDEFCADVVHQPSLSSEAPSDSGASTASSAKSQKPDPGNPNAAPSAGDHPNNGKRPEAPPAHGLNKTP